MSTSHQLERMIQTLLATMNGDERELAAFLIEEARSPVLAKRRLAQEIINYVHDRQYLVGIGHG